MQAEHLLGAKEYLSRLANPKSPTESALLPPSIKPHDQIPYALPRPHAVPM